MKSPVSPQPLIPSGFLSLELSHPRRWEWVDLGYRACLVLVGLGQVA